MSYTVAKVVDLLSSLENESSTSGKKIVIREYISHDPSLKEFLFKVLSADITFGINSKTFTQGNLSRFHYKAHEDKFKLHELIDYLIDNNTGTNDSKIEAVSHLMSYASDPEYFDYIKRILLRNLRVGIDAKTVNSALGYELIPIFQVQLAAAKFRSLPKKYVTEYKYDGVRLLTFVDERYNAKMFTRNGKQVFGFHKLLTEIRQQALIVGVNNFVLDGELFCNEFKGTMEQLFSKEIAKTGRYFIFDYIPDIEDFLTQKCDLTLWQRKLRLATFLPETDQDYILQIVAPQPASEDDIHKTMDEAVSQGYEGIIIKDLDSFYNFKRDYTWQKLKRFHTEDLECVEVQEGEGKYKGTLGAIVVIRNGVRIKVGSGFTDEQRDEIWSCPEAFLGKIAEIPYQEVIAESGSLRFPTFKQWRHDK